jgi:D-alanine-D-alanine ligase
LRRVQRVALDAYRVTGCRDYARLDLRLTPDDHPFVLEVNPNPDLTEGVSFMESAEKADYEFDVALGHIVEMALDRAPPATSLTESQAPVPLLPVASDPPGAPDQG